jgi:glycosyltransferase involved in cell wall biosynthesis
VTRARVPVAIVLNSFHPGGTERQMAELICRIDRDYFEVHVACLSRAGALHAKVAAAVPVTEFAIDGLISAGAARQALRFGTWCQHHRIAIVHACDFYANVFALPASAIARVPVRIGSRRDLYIPERTAAQNRAQRLAYRCAHRVVANSGAAAARLEAEGVPPQKVVQIPNGIDVDLYSDAPDFRPPRITTVAHVRPGKGIDDLLGAAALLCRERPDVTFRIAGDGSLRGALEARRDALGLTECVHFLGHVSDIPALLRESGVFAFPSLMEASPNAVIEAMAAGLAVVATDVGGIPEVVERERTGVLVPPGDPRALARELGSLVGDRERCERLGLAARAAIRARFSFERMVEAFEALYVTELRRRRPDSVPQGGARVQQRSLTAAHRNRIPAPVDQFESKFLQ